MLHNLSYRINIEQIGGERRPLKEKMLPDEEVPSTLEIMMMIIITMTFCIRKHYKIPYSTSENIPTKAPSKICRALIAGLFRLHGVLMGEGH